MEDMNRFLRGYRVLTLDRQCHEGVWRFCVTYQPSLADEAGSPAPGEKIDYKQALDAGTFALFSHLRTVRKMLAEKEGLPPYAVFTNEQLAGIARCRCGTQAELGKIDGVGPARLEKYGAAMLAAITEHAKLQSQIGTNRGPGEPA